MTHRHLRNVALSTSAFVLGLTVFACASDAPKSSTESKNVTETNKPVGSANGPTAAAPPAANSDASAPAAAGQCKPSAATNGSANANTNTNGAPEIDSCTKCCMDATPAATTIFNASDSCFAACGDNGTDACYSKCDTAETAACAAANGACDTFNKCIDGCFPADSTTEGDVPSNNNGK